MIIKNPTIFTPEKASKPRKLEINGSF